jgi:glycerol uptake facilitator-like aquaporin
MLAQLLGAVLAATLLRALFGPACHYGATALGVCGDSSSAWIYIVGPILGAAIAVIFEWILKGPPTREGTKTAQGRETT